MSITGHKQYYVYGSLVNCSICENMMKMSQDQDDFITHCKKIASNFSE